MKRTYTAPAAERINMHTEGFLCASYKFSDTEVNSGWSNKKEYSKPSIWDEE